jgi:single-stranded DNA-specific DHH superfamily exonuclease
MILSIEQAVRAYELIIKGTKAKRGKILIFTSIDLDSICSLRILLKLLHIDHIDSEIVPVINIVLFEEQFNKYQKSSNVGGIFFINCGSTVDFSSTWANDCQDLVCMLTDIHRPVHHKSINELKNFIIINDDCYSFENCPTEEGLHLTQILSTLITTQMTRIVWITSKTK